MNVLEVVIGPYPEIRGGVDKMVSLLIAGLARRGCGIVVLVPGTWAVTRLQSRKAGGVTVYERRLRLPLEQGPKWRSLLGWLGELPRTLLDLRRICRRHAIDVVHIHTATNYVYWFRLLRLIGGPPYVVTFHRGDVVDFPTRRKPDQALIRWGLAGAASTNAVSRWLAEEAERVFPGLCAPVRIYNGIPPASRGGLRPEPVSAALMAAPYVVMVGTFDPYKGHDVAIRAWALLPSDAPHKVIVGAGELRPGNVKQIAEQGSGGRGHQAGQLPNAEVQQLVAGAIAMVFPSRNEGFGYVILEAGLAATPVICSRIPPFDEIVVDGESGVLVAPEDPAALAAAVSRISQDETLRRGMGEALRRTVETQFSDTGMVEGYLALFRRVVER